MNAMSGLAPAAAPASEAKAFAHVVPFPTPEPRRPESRTARVRVSCNACALRGACLSSDFSAAEIGAFEDLAQVKRRLRAGQHLYRTGESADSLFVVRSGFMKSSVVTPDGREQVTQFHMMGDLTGLAAMGRGEHTTDTVALEDTEVCEIPFAALQRLAARVPALQQRLYCLMAEEIEAERDALVLLGTMRAEERVASFLLDLGNRYHALGFSASRFVLRMSRADMGSYLGLRLETVSRLLSRFQVEGLLRVEGRSVQILDAEGLRSLIGQS
jgi:CRP/FNR family transcriptional regulator